MTDSTGSDDSPHSELVGWIQGMPIVQHLGINVEHVEAGHARLAMPYRRELSHADDGTFQGSAVGALANFAAGAASAALLPDGGRVMTVDFTVKLVAPARGSMLVADARTLRPGRTLMTGVVEVHAVEGGDRLLCAWALGGLRVIPPA